MKKLMVVAVAAALVVVADSGEARADEACSGTLGAVSIDDNVIVPDGATCALDGTSVGGNVLVGSGSVLRAEGATIGGNVQIASDGSAEVTVVDSGVDGDVQVFEGTDATVTRTEVGGNVQLDDNSGDLSVGDSTVDGNVQLFGNVGGSKDISGNTIGGNLQCTGNEPAPTGGDNEVEGDAEDQCADLQAGSPGGPVPDNGPFDDVPSSHVFSDDISALAASGITRGCDPPANDRFCPGEAVERGQMAAFLVRAGLTD